MEKMHVMRRLASIADELDRHGHYVEADQVTNVLARFAQWSGAEYYNTSGQDQSPSSYKSSLQTGQDAPEGYEWSPQGFMQPKGHGSQYAGQQYYQSLGTAAFNKNPNTQQQARPGMEWSPGGFEQPAGTGEKWKVQQVQAKYPGWSPSATTPAPAPAPVASASLVPPTAMPTTNWSQKAPALQGQAPAQYHSQHNRHVDPSTNQYVAQALQTYQTMYMQLKQNPQFMNDPQGAKQYVINHAKQNSQSPEFVNMLVRTLI